MRGSLFLLVAVITINGVRAATTKYKYLGCYEDRDDIHMFSIKTNIDGTPLSFRNPNPCTDKCAESGYPYAGVNGQECFCSHDYAPDTVKTSDFECDSFWQNKFPDIVYPTRMAVFETGNSIGNIRPAKIYLGCYRDDNAEFRLIKSTNHQFQTENSPSTCHDFCVKEGHRYFGLTNHFECWCGDTRPSKNVLVDEAECQAPCTGNPATKCGGGWRLSVYATGITDYPSDGRYVGCYKHSEEDKVFVAEYGIVLKSANSPRRCLNICNQFGYKFAAVQNRDGCYCGNQLPPSSNRDLDKKCDIIKCVGDPTEMCGSKYHMKVYKTLLDEPKSVGLVGEYLGCYRDQPENTVMEESLLSLPDSLTPKLCIEICQQRGFPFAGLRYGKYCHCDYYYPSAISSVPEAECFTPCPGSPSEHCGGPPQLSAYYTGAARSGILPGSIYRGCFKDDNKDDRMLKGSWQELDNDSPRVCQRLCYKTGYLYFGLTWIRECFCGDEDPFKDLLVDETECHKPCGGDSNKICGGGWRTSIYNTGLTEFQIHDKYIGCYNAPSEGSSILQNHTVTLSPANSLRKCLNICDQRDYKYAGLIQGTKCQCGNTLPDSTSLDPNGNACVGTCPGEVAEYCGLPDKISIYATTKSGTPSVEAGSIKERVDIVTDSAPICNETYTTKNGQKTCKGEVIFNEDFQTLNSTVWKHEIKMPTSPDYEFVTFTDSSDIVYVKDGKLVIKPQLQPASYVGGKIDLPGCTGRMGSEECTREAYSFNVLPPVLSGRLNTKENFSFKYGTIEVKARLPTGDWIVPEIRLVPKHMSYGKNYLSGQIRIVTSRGNKFLMCGNRDLGRKNLEFGVYFGVPENVKRKVVTRYMGDETFHDQFHVFKLLWTPDNLQFFLDDSPLPPLLPSAETSMYNVTAQPSNAEFIWGRGTKLAPFDDEFFINLGVSVGGVKDFPDGCCSIRKHKKPWSNNSPKSMLNFWQTRDIWKNSWLDGRPELEFEYVKVTAL